jgi:hypothetical protein
VSETVPVCVVRNDRAELKAMAKDIAGEDGWLCPGQLMRVVVCGGRATLVVKGDNECILVVHLLESQFQGMVASVMGALVNSSREKAGGGT